MRSQTLPFSTSTGMKMSLTWFPKDDPEHAPQVYLTGEGYGTGALRVAVVDERVCPPAVTVARSSQDEHFQVAEADATKVANFLAVYARHVTEFVRHTNEYYEAKLVEVATSEDCEGCGCIIAAGATLCDTCATADMLEADLSCIVTEQVERLDSKYRKGAKEHGGRGWEMATAKLVSNAQDEVTDLTCYLSWLAGHVETIREMAMNAICSVEDRDTVRAHAELTALLELIEGKPNRG